MAKEDKGREGYCVECGEPLAPMVPEMFKEDGDHILYPYECKSCGHEGEEVYNVTFVEVR